MSGSDNGHKPDLLHEKGERKQFTEVVVLALSDLWAARKLVIGFTAAVAIIAVAITLMLPNWYKAEARVLPPESSGGSSIAAAMLRNLPGAAAAFLGSSGGDYSRYLTILTSRRLLDEVIEEYNLRELYDVEDSRFPQENARRQLLKNVDFRIDNKYDFLSIEVADKSPERAASMANFIVNQLNVINAELTSENAGNYRRFVEGRYHRSLEAVDSLLDASQAFQQQFGIIDVPSQATGFYEQLGAMRAEVVKAEIQYEALREQYGDDNPQTQAARAVVSSANRKYQEALSGSEVVLPVPMAEMPSVVRRYADLERARIMESRILEVIAPLYEQARFDEEREVQAVQVVDFAAAPERKDRPKRMTLVIVATMSALVAIVFFAVVRAWMRRNRSHVREFIVRVRQNDGRSEPVKAL
jgi:tyrosine-protein kinase Etk/Wzc